MEIFKGLDTLDNTGELEFLKLRPGIEVKVFIPENSMLKYPAYSIYGKVNTFTPIPAPTIRNGMVVDGKTPFDLVFDRTGKVDYKVKQRVLTLCYLINEAKFSVLDLSLGQAAAIHAVISKYSENPTVFDLRKVGTGTSSQVQLLPDTKASVDHLPGHAPIDQARNLVPTKDHEEMRELLKMLNEDVPHAVEPIESPKAPKKALVPEIPAEEPSEGCEEEDDEWF